MRALFEYACDMSDTSQHAYLRDRSYGPGPGVGCWIEIKREQRWPECDEYDLGGPPTIIEFADGFTDTAFADELTTLASIELGFNDGWAWYPSISAMYDEAAA